MLHHISLPVSDLSAAKVLYTAALAALGYRLVAEGAHFAGFGVEEGEDSLALIAQTPALAAGPGFHWPLRHPAVRRWTRSTRRRWPMVRATTARRGCGPNTGTAITRPS